MLLKRKIESDRSLKTNKFSVENRKIYQVKIAKSLIYQIFEKRTKHLLCGIKGVRLVSYSSYTRSGTPSFITTFGFPYDR